MIGLVMIHENEVNSQTSKRQGIRQHIYGNLIKPSLEFNNGQELAVSDDNVLIRGIIRRNVVSSLAWACL
jgi:hypothetical protein